MKLIATEYVLAYGLLVMASIGILFAVGVAIYQAIQDNDVVGLSIVSVGLVLGIGFLLYDAAYECQQKERNKQMKYYFRTGCQCGQEQTRKVKK